MGEAAAGTGSTQGVKRFDGFQRSLQVARNTLSDRLGKLVDAGVLAKEFYQDNPPRYEYLLTQMGRDLFPVVATILAWGDKWLDGGLGAPVALHHETCRHDLDPQVVCRHCRQPVVITTCSSALAPDTRTSSPAARISGFGLQPSPARTVAARTRTRASPS